MLYSGYKNTGERLVLPNVSRVISLCFLRLSLLLPLLFFYSPATAQQNIQQPLSGEKGHLVGYKIEGGDTVYVDKIKPVYIFNRPDKRKKSRQWRDYYRTVYNFKKVYPYALLAKKIIREADSTITNTDFTARERDKYLKSYEKRLFKEFEKPLRNLSFSQGKLLLRLLDRELGQTSYYIIKNYRGGITAGFWQGIAKLFGSDLKRPYDKFGEDKIVEELVILYQQNSFDYLYYSMFGE